MSSRRLRRTVLRALVIAVLGVLAWVAVLVVQTYRDLSAGARDAAALQVAVAGGDGPGTRVALAELTEHTRDAADRTSGWTWAALTRLPVVGDDADGIRVASEVLADLSADGLAPLADTVSDVGALAPQDGRVPLETVAALREPVAQAAAAFAAADRRLAAEDSSGYAGRWRSSYRDLAGRVADGSEALAAADRAVQVLPGMLGQDERRRYLVVFQSNAELRATGGLPGAVAVVEADRGRIELVRQFAAATYLESAEPVLPLTPAEEAIYGEQLGTWFLDANFTPDFPRAADLWRARFEQDGEQVDGVVSLDVVALSRALAATGPVRSGDLTLTADDVVQTLLNTVYLDVQDPAAQDAIFQDVASAVFERVTGGVGNPRVLLGGLRDAADQHRVLVHSFRPEEQQVLAGTAVAGELATEAGTTPQVGVYLNDNTGSKMSYYLRTETRVAARTCVRGVQSLSGSATLTSDAPTDGSLPDSVTGGGQYGVAPGAQLVALRVHGPVDGTIGAVELDGEPLVDLEPVLQDRRPVVTTFLYVEPQDTVSLTWEMTTGSGQTGDTEVSVTPGVQDERTSSVVPSAC